MSTLRMTSKTTFCDGSLAWLRILGFKRHVPVHFLQFFLPRGNMYPQWQHQFAPMFENPSNRCGIR